MPELPEIETIANSLQDIKGLKVVGINKYRPNLRFPIPDLNFLIGEKISNVTRRSKYLIIKFDKGDLLIHLGMSGQLFWVESSIPAEKHDHFDLMLSNNKTLRLRDYRRFGAVLWQEIGSTHKVLKSLGPEPLTKEFNFKYFKKALSKKNSVIKKVIMDNSVVVGVGNIYASEALYLANISPLSISSSLSDKNIKDLLESIKYVLKLGIKSGGASFRDYQHVDGKSGGFAKLAKVYNKALLPCENCKSLIQSVMISNRNSFYCPSCQPLIGKNKN